MRHRGAVHTHADEWLSSDGKEEHASSVYEGMRESVTAFCHILPLASAGGLHLILL